MQITLTEVDIRAGIALYLASRGITGVNAGNLQVKFTAGRKGSGLTAEVVTDPDGAVAVEIKDDNGTTRLKAEAQASNVSVKEKSLADLPNALGGTAGVDSGVAGAAEDSKELEAKREQAEEVAPETKQEEAPVEETKAPAEEEGKSLFS